MKRWNWHNVPCGTLFVLLFSFLARTVEAQFLMDALDTGSVVKVSGYIQPQFQLAGSPGVESYIGGDFPRHTDKRFMLRRGRIRFDYSRSAKKDGPSLEFVIQIDGTERGVFIRDVWGRVSENKLKLFSATAGMFARPFGYEINFTSSDRESPERGRMSQILMRTERDLGMIVTIEPRAPKHPLNHFRLDAGFFNGQGLTSPQDFDKYKDFISRFYVKPYTINKVRLSAGLSYLNGGFLQNTRYINRPSKANGVVFIQDSATSNVGRKAPRIYYGIDGQVNWKHRKGATTLRAEYWQGTQTALQQTSETPGDLPSEPYYIRKFSGAFFYLLHRFDDYHQVGMKYDWYDPNRLVEGGLIGNGNLTGPADVRFNTLGFGYINYINDNLKLVLWYDIVRNESTSLPGYSGDIDDNILTCRLQFRF